MGRLFVEFPYIFSIFKKLPKPGLKEISIGIPLEEKTLSYL